jgi:hypothetical protein
VECGLSGGIVVAGPACPPLSQHGDLPVVGWGQCFAPPVDPVLDLGPCLGDRPTVQCREGGAGASAASRAMMSGDAVAHAGAALLTR